MARRTRFVTWCKRDPNDDTKIIYTFRMKNADGTEETKRFTSEDEVPFWMLDRIRNAWIKSIARIDEAWIVEIYED